MSSDVIERIEALAVALDRLSPRLTVGDTADVPQHVMVVVHMNPYRQGRAKRMWTVAAAGVLVVGGFAVLAVRGAVSDSTSHRGSLPVWDHHSPVSAVDFPLFVPQGLPDGMTLRSASDQTIAQPATRTAIYEQYPGTLGGKTLSVTVSDAGFDSWAGAGAALDVGGRRAVDLSRPEVAALVVEMEANRTVAVSAQGLSLAELTALVPRLSNLSIDPGGGPLFEPAPVGLTLTSDERGLTSVRSTELVYEDDTGGRSVSVHVYNGPSHAFAQYLVRSGSGEYVLLNGMNVFQSVTAEGERLTWEFAPGIVIEVVSRGLGSTPNVATGLLAVSDAEWRSVLASVSAVPSFGPGTTPTTAAISSTVPASPVGSPWGGTATTAVCTRQDPGPPPVTVPITCP
jgi:hypothetical protein